MAKKRGDNIIFRLKQSEKEELISWINEQRNVSDALRFLIEQEIALNGIRNLSEHIPAFRSNDYFYLRDKERVEQQYKVTGTKQDSYPDNEHSPNHNKRESDPAIKGRQELESVNDSNQRNAGRDQLESESINVEADSLKKLINEVTVDEETKNKKTEDQLERTQLNEEPSINVSSESTNKKDIAKESEGIEDPVEKMNDKSVSEPDDEDKEIENDIEKETLKKKSGIKLDKKTIEAWSRL